MSDLSREELRDVQMAAADAERLLNDPTLWPVLRVIKAKALNVAVYGPDGNDRLHGRMLAVAIDSLHTELRDLMDSAVLRAKARDNARSFE